MPMTRCSRELAQAGTLLFRFWGLYRKWKSNFENFTNHSCTAQEKSNEAGLKAHFLQVEDGHFSSRNIEGETGAFGNYSDLMLVLKSG